MLPRTLRLAAAMLLAAAAMPASAAKIKVTMENLAPQGGNWFTQSSIFFHGGDWDTFNTGEAASLALERQGEDGLRVRGEDGLGEPPVPHDGLIDVFRNSYAPTHAGARAELFNGPTPVMPNPERPDIVFMDFAPGDRASQIFEIDPDNPNNRFFSFVWMFLPSNDAFYGNDDPMAFQLFDANGAFREMDLIVFGTDILDLGTEVNDELPLTTAALMQMVHDTGTPENGVIANHPGYGTLNPPNGIVGDGSVLDDPRYFAANFDVPGFRVARIRVEQVPEPASMALLGLGAAALGYTRRRQKAVTATS